MPRSTTKKELKLAILYPDLTKIHLPFFHRWTKFEWHRLNNRSHELLDIPEDKIGSAQWVGHIMKRLQLTDRIRRKRYSGCQMYLIQRTQVLDMPGRYEVDEVQFDED